MSLSECSFHCQIISQVGGGYAAKLVTTMAQSLPATKFREFLLDDARAALEDSVSEIAV
jgi:hypothetical protein